jgi:Tfp pilus assembly protein PilV
MSDDHSPESGMVLFELLIAMTLIVGSITVAHTVYAKLVMKVAKLERSHAAWVHQKNQHEIAIYLNRFKSEQPNNFHRSKR